MKKRFFYKKNGALPQIDCPVSSVSGEKFPTRLANPPTPLTKYVKIRPCPVPVKMIPIRFGRNFRSGRTLGVAESYPFSENVEHVYIIPILVSNKL